MLNRQIASLQDQSVRDWQCLVFDDASTDRTVVERAVAGDPRFTIMPTRPHMGVYAAFEHLLIAASETVPIFLADQDDVWYPHKMQTLLSVGETAFSGMRVVDDRGRVLRDRFLPRDPSSASLSPAGLLMMNSASGTALMISQNVRRCALPFPGGHLRGWHDQWLAAVAARTEELHYVDEVLVDYTQHSGQVVGDGLRRVHGRAIRAFAARLQASGFRNELAGRSEWVKMAAGQLLRMPGPPDPELEALAAGDFAGCLFRAVARREVPIQRAALLVAGSVATGDPRRRAYH